MLTAMQWILYEGFPLRVATDWNIIPQRLSFLIYLISYLRALSSIIGIVQRFLIRETYRILIIVKYLIIWAVDEYQSKVNVRFNRKTAKIFIRWQFFCKSRNMNIILRSRSSSANELLS